VKILQIGKRYPPDRGGMETVIENLCAALAPRATVTALVSHAGRGVADETRDGVRVVRLPVAWRALSQDVTPGLARRIREHAGDVNVVHMPNPWAEWSALRSRAPGRWVAFYHTDITRHRLTRLLVRPMQRALLRRADAIVVTSPRYVDGSHTLPPFKDKCAVIPLGIDPAPYDPAVRNDIEVAAIRAQYGRHALFVGRAIYYKGLDVLMAAWRKIEGTLLIAGDGPLLPEVRALADKYGLRGRVHFLGEVGAASLVSHLHACELLVLPSTNRGEAFGLTQVEAMACGRPVVSTDLPSGVPWVNQHEKTGLVVPPRDAGALAAAIDRILRDTDLGRRLGQAGRERMLSEFTASLMARRHLELYERLTAEGRK
jgi:glycosyltransferase involved in cell wall biosynthesis